MFYYDVPCNDNQKLLVDNYLNRESIQKFVLIHYQGNTSKDLKNLSHDNVAKLCKCIIQKKYTPIILDWDKRSPLPDDKSILCPRSLWNGEIGTLVALIDRCSLFVGVDSGPLHVAGFHSNVIGVWTGHHPLNYYDLSSVLHLIPNGAEGHLLGEPTVEKKDFFEREYRSTRYSHLETSLCDVVMDNLE